MSNNQTIQVFEWGRLKVGQTYEGVMFKQRHLEALARYAETTDSSFYTTFFKEVRFNQHVGVIKVGDLTIEVLPKVDKGTDNKRTWQYVLLHMLLISFQVEVKTTSQASINLRNHSVLDAYLQLFLIESDRLIHQGLVKKYRSTQGNRTSLKGKLLVHEQVTKNATHAERFYVEHQVYDQDNVFNFILRATLEVVDAIGSTDLKLRAQSLLLYFPECDQKPINERLFDLDYDRKTDGYKRAITLARIILLNFHPDLSTGKDDLLAIMFDMNDLWEVYIYWCLKRACRTNRSMRVLFQQSKNFWKPSLGSKITLRPDLVVEDLSRDKRWVLDTKWKYESKTSVEDVRQLFTYAQYFDSKENYLVYPATLDGESIRKEEGDYFSTQQNQSASDLRCGRLFVDLLCEGGLDKETGIHIINQIEA
ncbi:McrC family protein [Ekhidna sp.]|uniref:McrC family protein n=1 Tax=Ekhidna sp. TaxID=2608089 RepID=UPI003B5A6F1F